MFDFMVWNISQFLGNLIYRIRVVCLGDSIFDNDFPEEFEDDITVSENAFTYKKSLLFGKHYEQIYLYCKSQIKNIKNTFKVKYVNTCYFSCEIDSLLAN